MGTQMSAAVPLSLKIRSIVTIIMITTGLPWTAFCALRALYYLIFTTSSTGSADVAPILQMSKPALREVCVTCQGHTANRN